MARPAASVSAGIPAGRAAGCVPVLPITAEQWQQEFNKPHILGIAPDAAEPGATIAITGQNFDPTIDRVFFDGVNVGPVASATQALFVVPANADGGHHPVVIRPVMLSARRSNRAMLRVLPVLNDLPDAPRWIEGRA